MQLWGKSCNKVGTAADIGAVNAGAAVTTVDTGAVTTEVVTRQLLQQ